MDRQRLIQRGRAPYLLVNPLLYEFPFYLGTSNTRSFFSEPSRSYLTLVLKPQCR